MSHRPIIDAGPGLNFFSINKERLLIERKAAQGPYPEDLWAAFRLIRPRLRAGLP